MSGRSPGDGDGMGGGPDARWDELDRALVRLEDVLHELPLDRAVPDLRVVLHRAGVDQELLRRDDRALKLLREALLARPFGSLESVVNVRTEVELLTLEVDVLADRLRDPGTSDLAVAAANARLAQVRVRLEQLRREL